MLAFSRKNWRFSGMKALNGVRLNGCRSTSASAKSVFPVRFKTRFEGNAVLDVDSAHQWKKWRLPCLLVIARQSVRLNNEESSASDVLDAPQISSSETLVIPKVRR